MLYVAQRYFFVKTGESTLIPKFKLKLALEGVTKTEQSKFSYMYILNEKADSPSTIKKSLGILYEAFGIHKKTNHLVVAGDGATVKLLYDLKHEYGEALDWVIPFLGVGTFLKFPRGHNEDLLGGWVKRFCKGITQTINITEFRIMLEF